jgi:malate synthase
MIINALNSGAQVFMADFEDSSAPTFENMVQGQRHLMDAARGTIEHVQNGKHYRLGEKTALLMVRPRGWHLVEENVWVDGEGIPAALFDFGLFFFHNAKVLAEAERGPFFYLPKLEGHLEARLWNEVFIKAQGALEIPVGTVKATVLIETLPAAFEMDEILYELREHAAGLNCGRWDYIFSFIKNHRAQADAILPDRGDIGMAQPFMRAYTQLVIKTCHRRGASAMGGMAAQIPIKRDPTLNDAAMAKVRADKEREAKDGHDGTWVAHPGLVPLAQEVFTSVLGQKTHQLEVRRDDVEVSEQDLLALPTGKRTEAGLRLNLRVGIQYLAAWLNGNGCVPLYDLMEDAATAEISRTQLWQWVKHQATLDDGRTVDRALVDTLLDEEMNQIRNEVGDDTFAAPNFNRARALFTDLVFAEECPDFLTLPAYGELLKNAE